MTENTSPVINMVPEKAPSRIWGVLVGVMLLGATAAILWAGFTLMQNTKVRTSQEATLNPVDAAEAKRDTARADRANGIISKDAIDRDIAEKQKERANVQARIDDATRRLDEAKAFLCQYQKYQRLPEKDCKEEPAVASPKAQAAVL